MVHHVSENWLTHAPVGVGVARSVWKMVKSLRLQAGAVVQAGKSGSRCGYKFPSC